jgi:hypothetical protein
MTKRIMRAAYSMNKQRKTMPITFAASTARKKNILQKSRRLRDMKGEEWRTEHASS